MKKPKTRIPVFFLILTSLALGGELLHAQSTAPPPPPVVFVNDVPSGVPINGLIGLALLAGTIFGFRKLKKHQ